MKKTYFQNDNLCPPSLVEGDHIGLVAPARSIKVSECHAAEKIFNNWGLSISRGKHLFGQNNQFSGTDIERAADFQQMIDDKSIRAIFCVRGGYGSVRIVDKLDFSPLKKDPKWIVGFSDISVFHVHLNQHYSLETLHAAMPVNMQANGLSQEALQSIRDALFGFDLSYNFGAHSFNREGAAEALLTGGNLSVIYSLMGSASDIDTDGKILFLEDLDEYLYHVDRMMQCLKRAGKLSNLAGLIIGGMNDMNDNPVPFGKTAYEIIADIVAEYDYPVSFGFPAGHIKDNRALILGRKVKLKVENNNCSLFFRTPKKLL